MTDGGEVSGTFAETSAGQLFARALERAWDGTLAVGGERELVVELSAGTPVRALVADGHARLGELLLERGLVSEGELAAALDGSLRPLGAALVGAGALDETTLARALGLQLLRRLVRSFGMPPSTPWHFVPTRAGFEGAPAPSRLDPLRLVAAGFEAFEESPFRVDVVLALLDDAPLVLRPGTALERFGFRDAAIDVTTRILAERPSFEALLAAGIADEATCRRVVYTLVTARALLQPDDARAATRALAVGAPATDAALPPTEPPPTEPPPTEPPHTEPGADEALPPASARAPEEPAAPSQRAVTRVQLRKVAVARPEQARADALVEADCVTRLGVDPQRLADATRAEACALVESAYRDRAAEWVGESLAPRVLQALEAARRTLLDPVERAAELDRLGIEPAPESRLSPLELRERAENALARQDPQAALRLCQRAAEEAPDDPDLAALTVWVQAQLPRPDLKVLALTLDDLLLGAPDHPEARYYRGLLRRRLGQDGLARQDFERVLTQRPEHHGARQQLAALRPRG